MKRKLRTSTIVVGAVVLVLLAASPRVRKLLPGMDSGRGASERDMRLPVSAIVIKPETLANKVLATGTVLANEEVDLRSETTGKIEKIFFSEGSKVKKKELLIKINDSELQAQRMRLESAFQVAQEKERRRKQLFEKQGISPEDYESARNELNGIIAQLRLIDAQIQKTELRAPFDGIIGL